MLAYYFALAARSLRRNPALTALIILAIGVGIGASMTTLTVFRAMAADPIADRASQLFVPQIDAWGPIPRLSSLPSTAGSDHLSTLMTYLDATALMRAHAATRQTAFFETGFVAQPPNGQRLPFDVRVRATYTDFFPMFEIPFRYGGRWPAAADQSHASVIVISRALDDKLFGGANGVGKTLRLDGAVYRIVGVLDRWNPVPRYYDLMSDTFGQRPDDVFMPMTRAVDLQKRSDEDTECPPPAHKPGYQGFLNSNCVWLNFWVQLPTAAAAARYRVFLTNYAAEQRRAGRFDWPPRIQLRNVRQWLAYEHVVSNEARILMLVSFSFLFVCLLNAMGLMLARTLHRAGDIGVRRALGANRAAVFAQGVADAAVIGVAGAGLGLLLTALGLAGLRALLAQETLLAHLDAVDVILTIGVAIVAALVAGLYPAWRATLMQPAWQLKTQ